MLLSLEVEAVDNSLSTRAICARAGAANRSKATPQSSGKITRTERGMDAFMSMAAQSSNTFKFCNCLFFGPEEIRLLRQVLQPIMEPIKLQQ
jgi:hypothetical protein